VKLDAGQLERVDKIHDDFGLPVDENADGLGDGSEFAANFPGVGGSHGAWGFFVEIEAEGPGAEFFGEAGVLRPGDTADLTRVVIGCACSCLDAVLAAYVEVLRTSSWMRSG